MWRVLVSRRFNHRFCFGKSDQMLSSRVYQHGHFKTEFIINLLFFDRKHCRKAYLWELKQMAKIDSDQQPLLPLDERFREAEQYMLDLDPPAKKLPDARDYIVCINNCKICQHCDGE